MRFFKYAKSTKLTLAVLISAAIISSAQASEQSEAKGFVEDANGSILFRTGYISRDKNRARKIPAQLLNQQL